jgi:hypothetical protein
VSAVRERPCLDGWYNRLHGAYVATMADVGVTGDLSPEDFLAAGHGRLPAAR